MMMMKSRDRFRMKVSRSICDDQVGSSGLRSRGGGESCRFRPVRGSGADLKQH